jgi:hypothetical protein
MNVVEYLTPILKIKNPLDELRFEFKDTLNKYLPEDEQIVERTIFDRMDNLGKVENEFEDEEKDLSIRRF